MYGSKHKKGGYGTSKPKAKPKPKPKTRKGR
jgi:hypothetical protein